MLINHILEDLKSICEEYYRIMWKVESEKYDEEFELMKKEFEVCLSNMFPHDTLFHLNECHPC